jgi:hypothetical protein
MILCMASSKKGKCQRNNLSGQAYDTVGIKKQITYVMVKTNEIVLGLLQLCFAAVYSFEFRIRFQRVGLSRLDYILSRNQICPAQKINLQPKLTMVDTSVRGKPAALKSRFSHPFSCNIFIQVGFCSLPMIWTTLYSNPFSTTYFV